MIDDKKGELVATVTAHWKLSYKDNAKKAL